LNFDANNLSDRFRHLTNRKRNAPRILARSVVRSSRLDLSSLIRDYVLASIGFEALAKKVGKKPESIKRMLSVKGNPTINNMAALLASLKQHEGIQLHVETTR